MLFNFFKRKEAIYGYEYLLKFLKRSNLPYAEGKETISWDFNNVRFGTIKKEEDEVALLIYLPKAPYSQQVLQMLCNRFNDVSPDTVQFFAYTEGKVCHRVVFTPNRNTSSEEWKSKFIQMIESVQIFIKAIETI